MKEREFLLHCLNKGCLLIAGFLFLFLIIGYSCDPEWETMEIALKPPLSLTATNNATNVILTWWGLNDEQFFEGYRVFLSTNSNDAVTNLETAILIPPITMDTNKPTVSDGMYTVAKYYRFVVRGIPKNFILTNILTNIGSEGLTNLTNISEIETNVLSNIPFVEGGYYSFCVRAYTSLYAPYYSPPSNITNIIFTTNTN